MLLRRETDGAYTVIVPALLGCLTETDTIADALLAAKEAVECYLESLMQHKEPIPEEGLVLSFGSENLTDGFFLGTCQC